MGFVTAAGAAGNAGRANGCNDQSLGRLSMDGTTGIFGLFAAESAGVLAPDLLAAVVAAVFFAALLPTSWAVPRRGD